MNAIKKIVLKGRFPMPDPNELSENVRFAVFNCPKEFSDQQLEEIRAFAEYIKRKRSGIQK